MSEWLCREEGLQWQSSAQEELQSPFEEPCTDIFLSDNTLPDTGIPVANNSTLKNGISNCEGTKATSNVKRSKVNFKLVLAEPLPDSPWSHVNTFLEAHGGPGLQVNYQ